MSDIAISVEGVSKQYRRGIPIGNDRMTEVLSNLGRGLVSGPRRWLARSRRPEPCVPAEASADFWALKDVSFDVRRGEVVGIIGRNGAGKSTLLKILSRITEPTAGRFGVRGRVGSLLEVGTGFHQELTGRENIFLNGTVLGMSRREVLKKFDEIVAFSEIEAFLDTPAKRYSSGMYVRLAFAVAAHLEPEILIVDEVLAVGDARFQKKCLGRLGEIAAGGRTVLFVSHNTPAVLTLCHRAVWLSDGRVLGSGEAKDVVSEYLELGTASTKERHWAGDGAPGDDRVRLRSASVAPCDSTTGTHLTVDTALRFRFEFSTAVSGATFHYCVTVSETERGCIFQTHSAAVPCPAGLVCGEFVVPGGLLNDGTYTVRVQVMEDGAKVRADAPESLVFQIHDVERSGAWFGKWAGAVRPTLAWTVSNDVRPIAHTDGPDVGGPHG
ncbi:ABC transporter ATP-binding protein [Fimbriiglobus ruber]|uniref:Teichoic acid export ATP-binding protein TagH n=1 Tax=Fimbriiglobus ruber TaxID=1908690 RepID=A0A225E1P4_9BACT|nr:ABC transporter ATP-binding protein [Fimbriiglobus ruber]OWK43956.1 Teichoic acid export ATP-binding protein TagH [Fimbriiglobus ruber]